VKRHGCRPALLFVLLVGGVSGCAARFTGELESFTGEEDRHGVVLSRVHGIHSDGSNYEYWVAIVPEGLVVESLGQDAVDACYVHIAEGGTDCLGRVSETTQFRYWSVNGQWRWDLEVDRVDRDYEPRPWVFSRRTGDGGTELKHVEF